MRAGPLRHRVELQSETQQSDGMGGGRKTWAEYGKAWAGIDSPSGRTSPVAQQLVATVTVEITMRPRSDLKAGHRIVHGSTTYTVEAILPDNLLSMFRVLCSTLPDPQRKTP